MRRMRARCVGLAGALRDLGLNACPLKLFTHNHVRINLDIQAVVELFTLIAWLENIMEFRRRQGRLLDGVPLDIQKKMSQRSD